MLGGTMLLFREGRLLRRSSASLKKAALAKRSYRRFNIRRERKRPSLFRRVLPRRCTLKNKQRNNQIKTVNPAIIKIYSKFPALQDMLDCLWIYSKEFERNSQQAIRRPALGKPPPGGTAPLHSSCAMIHLLGWEPGRIKEVAMKRCFPMILPHGPA